MDGVVRHNWGPFKLSGCIYSSNYVDIKSFRLKKSSPQTKIRLELAKYPPSAGFPSPSGGVAPIWETAAFGGGEREQNNTKDMGAPNLKRRLWDKVYPIQVIVPPIGDNVWLLTWGLALKKKKKKSILFCMFISIFCFLYLTILYTFPLYINLSFSY